MSLFDGVRVRLRSLLRREEAEAELDDEIAFHIEMATEQLISRGVPPDQARRQALVDFGGVERFKEGSRTARGVPGLEELARNVRASVRKLRANPLHTAAVVGTLALGIGANAAIFSATHAVLLRPSPFPEPDRLVMVWETDRNSGTSHEPASWPDVVDFRERSTTLSAIGAFMSAPATILQWDAPERISAVAVTPDLFEVLGIRALEGRLFAADEGIAANAFDNLAGSPVLIGSAFWRDRYDSDPGVIGQDIATDSGRATIVGVLPEDAQLGLLQVHRRSDYGAELLGTRVDLWFPLAPTAEDTPRYTHPFFALGRLAPGTELPAAQEELSAIAADLEAAYPENDGRGVNLEAHSEVVFGPVRPALSILFGGVVLVLLIACANVANLILARSSARRREVAIRRAFGASDGQLVRQFFVESLVLVGLATAGGLALAYASLRVIIAYAPPDVPRLSEATLSVPVLAFTVGLGALVAFGFGLLPSRRRGGSEHGLVAREGHRETASRASRRYRSTLVTAEVALAVALVVSAGILLRSLWTLESVDPGFQTAGTLTAEYNLPATQYPTAPDEPGGPVIEFHARYLEAVRAIPGVQAAALAVNDPMDAGFTNSFIIVGRQAESEDFPEIRTRFVSPGYLEVLGIPLLEGRVLDARDDPDGPRVAMLNRTAAERYFPGTTAVGQTLGFWGIPWQIVGVIGDERFRGLDQPTDPAIYASLGQLSFSRVTLLARASGDPMSLLPSVRGTLAELDPGLALFNVESLTEIVEGSVSRPRFTATLLGLFAAVAILLALIGVYGVLSYVVLQRRPELGVRLALGAGRQRVFRDVVGEGLRVTAIGIAIGVVAALAVSRLLQGLVFGVSATDLRTYLIVPGLVLVGAVLASVVPAARAAREDPNALLRTE